MPRRMSSQAQPISTRSGRLTLLRVIQESLTNVMKHGDKKGLVSGLGRS